MWTIDVHTADLDAIKRGILSQRVSRVHLSRTDFPHPLDAEVAAAQIAMAMHGGTATRVGHCL